MKNSPSGCVHLHPSDTEEIQATSLAFIYCAGGDSKKNVSCSAKNSKVLVSACIFEKKQTNKNQANKKKALDPSLISYTFSSYKTYYRVFFNVLLNNNTYFEFGSNEQNNGEFEIDDFLTCLLSFRGICDSPPLNQSTFCPLLYHTQTVYWTNTGYETIQLFTKTQLRLNFYSQDILNCEGVNTMGYFTCIALFPSLTTSNKVTGSPSPFC